MWWTKLLNIFKSSKEEKQIERWEDSYYYALLKSYEEQDRIRDEKLLIDYKYEIKRDALEKYNWWWSGSTDIYIGSLKSGVRYVAKNHEEVYPESHEYYVNQEYERLKNTHSEKEKKEIEERRARNLFGDKLYEENKKLGFI